MAKDLLTRIYRRPSRAAAILAADDAARLGDGQAGRFRADRDHADPGTDHRPGSQGTDRRRYAHGVGAAPHLRAAPCRRRQCQRLGQCRWREGLQGISAAHRRHARHAAALLDRLERRRPAADLVRVSRPAAGAGAGPHARILARVAAARPRDLGLRPRLRSRQPARHRDEAAVRQRVQKLVDSGVIQIVAVTDPLTVGSFRMAMIGVRVEGDITSVADQLGKYREVDYVVVTAGNFDILVEAICDDDEHLLELLQRIRAIPSVRSTESFVYLKLQKQLYNWGT